MSGKLKRQKPKIAKAINLEAFGGNFSGERAYARVEQEDKMKARGIIHQSLLVQRNSSNSWVRANFVLRDFRYFIFFLSLP